MIRKIIIAAFLCLCVSLLSVPAAAHAYLITSSPADGDVLKAAPDRIILHFNEAVEPLALTLVDPKGDVISLEASREPAAQINFLPPKQMGRGTHLISWRVMSADGHAISGSLVFSIGQVSSGPALAPSSKTRLAAPLIMARFILLSSLALGAGGIFFLVWLGNTGADHGRARVLFLAASVAGLYAGTGLIGLSGLDAHEKDIADLLDMLMWRTGLRTPYATSAILIFITAIAGIAALNKTRFAGSFACITLAAAAASIAVSSHARLAPPLWLTPLAIWLHAGAIILWLGALIPLAVSISSPSFRQTLRRFSRLALPAYMTILITGALLAFVQSNELRTLFDSPWGQLLAAKLVLVSIITGLAIVNRYRLSLIDERSTALLRRNIYAEIALALCVLLIASAWRITPPPRALAIETERKFQIHIHGIDAMASVSIAPARAGPVKIRIEPKTADLSPLAVKGVTIHLTREESGLAPLRREAQAVTPALWETDNLIIPAPGRWRLRIDLLVNDFERTPLNAVIDVAP